MQELWGRKALGTINPKLWHVLPVYVCQHTAPCSSGAQEPEKILCFVSNRNMAMLNTEETGAGTNIQSLLLRLCKISHHFEDFEIIII